MVCQFSTWATSTTTVQFIQFNPNFAVALLLSMATKNKLVSPKAVFTRILRLPPPMIAAGFGIIN